MSMMYTAVKILTILLCSRAVDSVRLDPDFEGHDPGFYFKHAKKVILILPDRNGPLGVRAVHALYTGTEKGRITHYIFTVVKNRRLTDEIKEYPQSGDILAIHRYDKHLKLEDVASVYVSSESGLSVAELKAEEKRIKEKARLAAIAARRKQRVAEPVRKSGTISVLKRPFAHPTVTMGFYDKNRSLRGFYDKETDQHKGRRFSAAEHAKVNEHLHHTTRAGKLERQNFRMDAMETIDEERRRRLISVPAHRSLRLS